MKFGIKSDLPAARGLSGRLRLKSQKRLTESLAGGIEEALQTLPFVTEAKVSYVTGSLVICFEGGHRNDILSFVSELTPQEAVGEHAQNMNMRFRERIYLKFLSFAALRLLLPMWLRMPINIWQSSHYVSAAAAELREGKFGVSVLDEAAVLASQLSGDWNLASSIMLLLGLGEILEEHTKEVARGALRSSLAMNVEYAWLRIDGTDKKVPLDSLRMGDHVVVRAGSFIPVDGEVVGGEAAVNQASLTGEPMAVLKSAGDSVYAGTTIEEGSLLVEVRVVASESRIAHIVEMVEESESLKAPVQFRAEKLAESIVPFNFLLAGIAYFFGGPRAGLAGLLVHYSCTIELATPIAVLSALREAAHNKLAIRGGKYLELAAEVDTIVFDKTGTLSTASPTVSHVGAYDEFTQEQVLRIAACIEEHFPHSLARAVVHKAEEMGIDHEEMHAEVEYIAAHGIATSINRKRVVIGSGHFVLEDESVRISEGQEAEIEEKAGGGSVVYLGVDGHLAGYLCIADPPRAEAAEVIRGLKQLGVSRIIMLTGDGEKSAGSVAAELGIEEYRASMMPEDKREFIMALKAEGHKIMMVGDGINDSPSLAEADVSVAMRDAADLARETANITLLGGDLHGLISLRLLGQKLLKRVYADFRYILTVNTTLFGFGFAGMLTSEALAVLHNASTVLISAASMQPLLDNEESVDSMPSIKGSDRIDAEKAAS